MDGKWTPELCLPPSRLPPTTPRFVEIIRPSPPFRFASVVEVGHFGLLTRGGRAKIQKASAIIASKSFEVTTINVAPSVSHLLGERKRCFYYTQPHDLVR